MADRRMAEKAAFRRKARENTTPGRQTKSDTPPPRLSGVQPRPLSVAAKSAKLAPMKTTNFPTRVWLENSLGWKRRMQSLLGALPCAWARWGPPPGRPFRCRAPPARRFFRRAVASAHEKRGAFWPQAIGSRDIHFRSRDDSRARVASCTPLAPSSKVQRNGSSATTCFKKSSHCTLNALS